MTAFGEYMKLLRERAGISQETLADEAEISSAYVSQIETGRRNPPTPDVLRRMAAPLGVPYTVLLMQADHLHEAELQTLLLHALRTLFAQGTGREEQIRLLSAAIDRWMALTPSARQEALDSSHADHVAEMLLEALLQKQVDILFAALFPPADAPPPEP